MLQALVAGAGPAGATAALLLARAGVAVGIVERAAFPRTKACGEYLSAGSVRLLHELGLHAQLEPLAHPVRGVRLHGHGVRAQIDFPVSGWSLPREILDAQLLNAAIAAGAQLIRGRVEDCADGDSHALVTVRFPDGERKELQAQFVIGADGMHSVVARKSGFAGSASGSARFALGGHYTALESLDEYIDMFVDGASYAAVNPLTATTANVMLVVAEADLQSHRDSVETFAEDRTTRLAGRLLSRGHLDGKRIAIGPLSYRARRLAGAHIVLVGDAACFLDPFTGQGVSFALHSAREAARSLLTGDLAGYDGRMRREISSRERAARRVSRLIRSPLAARVSAAILRGTPRIFYPLIDRVTGAA